MLNIEGISFSERLLPSARVSRDGLERANTLTATFLQVDGQPSNMHLIGEVAPRLQYYLYYNAIAKPRKYDLALGTLNVLVLANPRLPTGSRVPAFFKLLEVPNLAAMQKGLQLGRADYVLLDALTADSVVNDAAVAELALQPVRRIMEAGMYIALSSTTHPAFTARIKQAYKDQREEIFKGYSRIVQNSAAQAAEYLEDREQ
ncbi:hypothetical protein ACFO5Q_17330 [Kordiimonas lipolytica]|uniref:Uncharacterized protein n=1 Tax=Kordiimonas lipolytica TaxID=1662421 RepID=A0ABV8UFH8_9PROT|nr:hypothetical protein [Kordiimonas lipolytica]